MTYYERRLERLEQKLSAVEHWTLAMLLRLNDAEGRPIPVDLQGAPGGPLVEARPVHISGTSGTSIVFEHYMVGAG